MPGKGGKHRIDHQLPCNRVVERDQGFGVVDQHLLRHPIPDPEGFLQRLQPVALALLPEHPHHLPARVAQGQHAEVHFGAHPADQHPQLTKVGLQLLAWPGLVANRGLTALAQRLSPGLHGPLDGAQAHHDALVFEQLLPHHLGVAVVLLKLLLQPLAVFIQLATAAAAVVGLPIAKVPVSAHGVA